MSEDTPIKPLDSRIAWSCAWYSIRQDRILLPDGSEGVYNVLQTAGQGSVWIVPLTPTRDVVMIRTYRYTLKQWVWELPAGSIKPGQTPLEAAQEELREEAGGQSEDWHLLSRLSTINGIGDHHGYFFLAQNVTLDVPHHEPAEVITVHTFPLSTALDMARSGQMNDALSVLALLLAAPIIAKDQTFNVM